ncbi:BZ3500_MvSof-1268-A1-R1_Chr2-2g04779 [Microbotryum saponariae]|uniref:BZ3500_MvSof-1268-A1-R1_Chr2-2g04779 protein n=1 Tax=Microbotryum saponariae TaxID=289078 RepID=A0A2X0KWD7_9BASI|nr:BZ3500_MvSof-1268-A1-R1_Chr2-2g04779 [Microbotryum saponariae]SDA00148.1 BZ3501_MvSof-1269-A2-R1_Chr2-2g04453 [Microbotryum saponariae]
MPVYFALMPVDAPPDSNRLSAAQALSPELLTDIAEYVRQFEIYDTIWVHRLNRDVCNASLANALLASPLIERYATHVLSLKYLDDVDHVKVIGGLRFVTELYLSCSTSDTLTIDQSVLQTFQGTECGSF